MKKNLIESWITTIIGVIIVLGSCYGYFFEQLYSFWTFSGLIVLGLTCVFVYEKGLKALFNKIFKING